MVDHNRSNSINTSYSFYGRSNSAMSSASSFADQRLPSDRNAHLVDNSCFCCGGTFLTGTLKKNCCTFCFRGVCGNCFIKQATHPETQSLEKICDNCFERQMVRGVSLLERLRNDIYELKQKYELEVRAIQKEIIMKENCDKEIAKLISKEKENENKEAKEIQILKENISRLEKEIEVYKLENQEKSSQIKSFENKIIMINNEAESLKIKYKNNSSIDTLRNNLIKIKEEYEILKAEVENSESHLKSSKAEEIELEMKKEKILGDIEKADEKIKELTQIARELEENENDQEEKIERLGKCITVYSRSENISCFEIPKNRFTDEYNELRNQINEKTKIIEQLKEKIKRYDRK